MYFNCDSFRLLGMLRDCIWKGRRISCAAIFSMQPTDQGMCCTFNKDKADEMFRENSFRDQIVRLTGQDKDNSRYGSKVPEWQVLTHFMHSNILKLLRLYFFTRYAPIAESGKSMGLSIMLDAHNDALSTSTTLDNFMVTSPILAINKQLTRVSCHFLCVLIIGLSSHYRYQKGLPNNDEKDSNA